MALTFDRPAGLQTMPAPEAANTAEAPEAQPYDILADKQAVVARLAGSDEIDALTSTIDVNDMATIVTFGSAAAEAISRASDEILRGMSLSQLDDSSAMMQALGKVMDRFNADELRDKPGLFGKLFGNVRKQLDNVLAKYHTMGDEVDKIYIELRKYEEEIKRSNQKLEQMFQANVGYFHELEKYIVAGEQGCHEIEEYMGQLKAEQARTGDQAIGFELQTLSNALNMLQQRTHDLRIAETVALQSIPMIKTIQFSNMNLVRKINSAFIVTLPVFKQALAQAILLKRQRVQAEALSALDRRTNEMLQRNAQNTVEQAKLTARMASGSSIRPDTLENTWRTIMDGIQETKQLQDSARAQRVQDQARLEAIRKDYMSRNNLPG